MSRGYYPKRLSLELTDLFSGLTTANHILHHHSLLDAYGHISVRNPDSKTSFFILHDTAPALATSPSSFLEFNIDDGEPTDKGKEIGWSERYIHSELYKKFPAVNCVIHSHSPDVIPFSTAAVPLKPTIHMSGFLGPEVPVWDSSSIYTSSEKHSLLVTTPKHGHSLALKFARAETSANFLYGKVSSAITGAKDGPSEVPEHPVVLMRGHGFAAAAPGIEEGVFMAIYTAEAARAQTRALGLAGSLAEGRVEGSVKADGGKIKDGRVKWEGEVRGLDARECRESWEVIGETVLRPWGLWCREVECNPLYKNECGKE
ncbi:hypothetical protein K402DRAFT_444248 [Aulographum hederae CBS 113979]|uniref:Class II aldolase/adducin N-terminal domain-containing protein n=1 Tax=Aulographum hederae CBS 113979 TaxID=1176131 RepID=A0A6G1HB07_9PEZI|nr:hypothetical protein K402DRAFT_444248 [Aulographum hederae CBS 113979]